MARLAINDNNTIFQDGIDNYDILDELAINNSSQTLRARCKRGRMKNRLVAIKKTPKTQNTPPAVLQLSLYHPSVNSLFSIFSNQTHQFHVLELCSGGSLADLIQSRTFRKDAQCLSDGMTRTIIKPLLDALVYLKKERIVHRDMSLQSILLTEEGRVKLSNFEKATRDTEQDFTAFSAIHNISDAEYLYVAPEILSRRSYDCSADLWSLGCVAFACVSGKSPFQVEVIDQVFENILRAKYSVPEYMSALLENFVDGLIQTEPTRRTDLSALHHHPFLDPRLPEESLDIDKTNKLTTAKPDRTPFQTKTFAINADIKLAKPQQLPFRAPTYFKENFTYSTNERKFPGSGSTRGSLKEYKNADLRRILSDEISYKRTIMGIDEKSGMLQDSKHITAGSDETQKGMVKERRIVSDSSGQFLGDAGPSALLRYPRAQGLAGQTRVPSFSSQGLSASATRVQIDKKSLQVSANEDDVQTLSSVTGDSAGPDLHDDLPVGTLRPLPFNTDLLSPRTHKTVQGQVTVLPSLSLLVDFREAERRRGMKGHEVLVVSRDGNQIQIYLAPHLSVPCCLVEPVRICTIDVLPKAYWRQYNDASTLISRIKQRTPRMVLYEQALKCTLMANGPQADVELLFFDPPSSNSNANSISSSSNTLAASKETKEEDLNDSPGTDKTKHSCKMRFRYSRQACLLEIAERIDGPRGREWMKKNIHIADLNEFSSTTRYANTFSDEERLAFGKLTWFSGICDVAEEGSDSQKARGAQVFDSSTSLLQFKPSLGSMLPVKDSRPYASAVMHSLSTIKLPPRPVKFNRSRISRKSDNADDEEITGKDLTRDTSAFRGATADHSTWPSQETNGYTPCAPRSETISFTSNEDPVQTLQTKFITGVGWCVRHASKISQGGRYKLMFLDGKVLDVDVDEEWVELVENGHVLVPRLTVGESHSKPMLSERMKMFEEFIALFDVD